MSDGLPSPSSSPPLPRSPIRDLFTEHGTSSGRLFLGSTARLNLPQFTADFPRFRMLPGSLASSDQIPPHARTVRVAPVLFGRRAFANAYVRKPRALISGSRLSPVLFNACLKLIKARSPLPPELLSRPGNQSYGGQPHYPSPTFTSAFLARGGCS